jgi:hypothetical protein
VAGRACWSPKKYGEDAQIRASFRHHTARTFDEQGATAVIQHDRPQGRASKSLWSGLPNAVTPFVLVTILAIVLIWLWLRPA